MSDNPDSIDGVLRCGVRTDLSGILGCDRGTPDEDLEPIPDPLTLAVKFPAEYLEEILIRAKKTPQG